MTEYRTVYARIRSFTVRATRPGSLEVPALSGTRGRRRVRALAVGLAARPVDRRRALHLSAEQVLAPLAAQD